MKRYFFLLAAMTLLASCSSDVLENANTDNNVVSHVTITATDFELDAATRTALEITSSGLSFTWAESDVVGIYPNTGDQVSFPMTKGAGTKTANFDGGGWALRGNYTYAAYYPYDAGNTFYARPYKALPISYVGQTQPANNSTVGMGAYDYMVATASTPESGNVTFNFSHINSVLYIQLTSPDAATFTKLTLSCEDAIFITEATVNISNGTMTPKKKSNEISLDLKNIAVKAGSTLYAWMLIAPVDASGKTLNAKLKPTISDSYYTAELTGKTFETGKAYKLEGTLTKSFDLNGHEYVDLGLPSRTLWATMNVGATSPEGYGNYYAWGEAKTKTEQGKANDYSEETYKWLSIVTTVDWEEAIKITTKTFTKYWPEGAYVTGCTGIVDNKTVLDAEDDAAAANWGGSWRMPTHADWDELTNTNYCTWTSATLNGVNGYKVMSKVNDKFIFLPAAGYRHGTSLNGGGSNGYYRSSSLFESFPTIAWSLLFYSDHVRSNGDDRYYGYTVRSVCRP